MSSKTLSYISSPLENLKLGFKSKPDKFIHETYQDSRPKRKERETNPLSSKKESEKAVVQQYFNAAPDRRIKIRQSMARQIYTVSGILEILRLGNTENVRDAYDAAIALLAECSGELLSFVIALGHNPVHLGGNIELLSPQQWEIAIKGAACSLTLRPYQKYSLMIGLMNNYDFWNRLVKTAIIDALGILEDIDPEIIKVSLELFISKREKDPYIREYAEEALEEILI